MIRDNVYCFTTFSGTRSKPEIDNTWLPSNENFYGCYEPALVTGVGLFEVSISSELVCHPATPYFIRKIFCQGFLIIIV